MTDIPEMKLMEKLAEMRGNPVLDRLDERYRKGQLDAIDLLLKWVLEQ